jgi:hypothetical protein
MRVRYDRDISVRRHVCYIGMTIAQLASYAGVLQADVYGGYNRL